MRLFRRSQREFEEEVRAHLDLETDQLIAEGHAPEAARQLARKRFGNVSVAQQRYYDSGPLAWLQDALSDARYALRMIRKHPGFSSSIMLISALGLVACVTTFSLVSGILLKPLPFPKQDHVFTVAMQGRGVETWAVPIEVYDSLSHSIEVEAIASSRPTGAIVRAAGELKRLSAHLATPSYFKVYRLKPALGRFFHDTEADAVVLGYEEWRTRYGSDTTVIGRVLTVDGINRRIVGVMPAGFQDPRLPSKDLWLPWIFDRSRSGLTVNASLRIPDAMEPERVEAMLRRHRAMVETDAGRDSVMAGVSLHPITGFRDSFRNPLLILLGAVLLVLALVAANVATMFLAQVSARLGELGVRRALGAGRGRQLRQLMVESMTLTGIGGAAGLAISVVAIAYVRTVGTGVLPRMADVGVDWRVAIFGLGVVLVTGLSGGLAQALASRDRSWAAASTRVTGARTSTLLVVTQMALSVTLLVGAGLLVKSFLRVAPDNPGFATHNRATILVGFVNQREKRDTSTANVRAAITRAQEGLRAVPGVEDVAVGSYLPLWGLAAIADVDAPALTGKPGTVYQYLVSDNYFTVMQMSVTSGRAFTADDGPGAERVAIVSEAAARKLFGRRDVVGARFRISDGTPKMEQVTIVGVVNDTRVSPYDTKMRAQVYLPRTQYPMYGVTFIAATSIEPGAVIPALQTALAASAPRAVVEQVADLEAIVSRSVARSRFFSVAMGLFAVAAALLTGLGIYGLLAYAVSQRRREIGIRLALGATPSRIGKTIVGRAALIAAIGVPIGLAVAYGLSRFMGDLLLEVEATDRDVFALVPVIALTFAIAAALAPVYQAARVDPNETMRA
jgi:putative ABC transport system permease protein